MSDFSDKMATALGKIRTAKGESITYRRGLSTVTITTATPADQQRRGRQDDGAGVDVNSQDWLIAVEELELDSTLTEPARGDVIEWEHGDITSQFEVLPQDGDAVFHFSDSGRSQFRIHTKRMDGETA